MKIIERLGKLKPTDNSNYVVEFVIVECDCGTLFKAQERSIKSGHTKSCGCLKKKAEYLIKTKHIKEANPRLYRIWKNLRTRVSNKNVKQYANYGGRGISACAEWDSFEAFSKWALSSGYVDGLSIDRIDVNGNYEPSNCRWSDAKEQAKNTQLLRSSNTSGFRGVSKKGWKYSVRATNGNKRVFIGVFDTPEEAADAYDQYVLNNGLGYQTNFLGASYTSRRKDETISTLARENQK